MRILFVFVIIGLIFSLGYSLGQNQDESVTEPNVTVIETSDDEQLEINMPERKTPAYKAASLLEGVFKFFAELIVDILYQISRLFYTGVIVSNSQNTHLLLSN